MTIYRPYQGKYPLSAGYRYSSGSLHAAWDIAMPIGTPLYAPRDGIVLGCGDGVHNNRPGERIYSGKPSNWVLLGVEKDGQKYGLYFQHLSPGIAVRQGQKIRAGQFLGRSGNSGNSSGPHLHNSAQRSWSTDRYLYLNNLSMCVYPPNKLWGTEQPGGPIRVPQKFPGRAAVSRAIKTGNAHWVSKVRAALNKQNYNLPINDKYDAQLKAAIKDYKRKHKLGLTARIGERMWRRLDIKRTL
jgi:hypothetical protein